MGFFDADDRYVVNAHPVVFRERSTGRAREFWPDTGCPALLRGFVSSKRDLANPIWTVAAGQRPRLDADSYRLMNLVDGMLRAHLHLDSCAGLALEAPLVKHMFPDNPNTGCAGLGLEAPLVKHTPDAGCAGLALEALLVKKMFLDNPDASFGALIERESVAFAVYRFLDHVESECDKNTTVMNFVGMTKSVIDERWNIELETEASDALWTIEDAAPAENPSSTPCPLERVFAPGFYRIPAAPAARRAHPVALRARESGRTHDFWPDTGCPALLRAFAARKGVVTHPMSLLRRAVLQEAEDDSYMQYLYLVRCINCAIGNYSGGDECDECDALVLEALIVKKMLLDNPGVRADTFLAEEARAFALYRFLDHLESLTESGTVMSFTGMLKSEIDDIWSIGCAGAGREWIVEEVAVAQSKNPSSTPCLLDRVFAPRFYKMGLVPI